jgi:hypothetical protein
MAVERRRADQRQPQPDLRKLGWSVVDNERTHLGNPVNLADATEPAWNGYLLTVACPCGVVFERWVTPEEADADLLRLAALN